MSCRRLDFEQCSRLSFEPLLLLDSEERRVLESRKIVRKVFTTSMRFFVLKKQLRDF